MIFRIGSIPVRITGSFLLTALLLSGVGSRSVAAIAIWTVVVFFSVLLHELGHAIAGRIFGLSPQIELHGFGGTTSWTQGRKLASWQSIVVSLAGPLTGIVVGGLAFFLGALRMDEHTHPLVQRAMVDVIWVNAGWGALNLVPMLPLDGGNVMATLLNVITKGRGERPSRIVSIVVAIAGAGVALKFHQPWIALLSGLFAFRNVQAIRQSKLIQEEGELYENLSRGFAALERQDGREAIAMAEPVYRGARTPELRFEALRLLAYARVLEGHWGPLMTLIESDGKALGADELTRLETAARECGRPDEADRIKAIRAALAGPEVPGFRA
jgi:Zn-dependent protease